MFGLKFIKVQPTVYLLEYKNGRVIREGAGLSLFYFAPTTSLAAVPIGSTEVPFIFEEVTADFQTVTTQGQVTYRVADPKQLASLMSFTLEPGGRNYASEDPQKLPQRLINHTQVLTRASLKGMSLREALGSSAALVAALRTGLQEAGAIRALGIEILDLSILAIKPMPETARALEAESREEILRHADEAIYSRRNAAVEQERAIKENELNTEIAVENKKRGIREAKMDADKAVQAKQRELQEAEMDTQVGLEKRKQDLVGLVAANQREEADAKAYSLAAVMKALAGTDAKVLAVLASVGMEPSRLVALAFKELAEGAAKIGQLNVTPDLLRELMAKDSDR